MHLTHLAISGFRGTGSPLSLELAYRTIIYGPNGSGKSSILQSIVWALYGKLPDFTGGVFTREDALVNDFLENGKADIALSMSDGTTIARTRTKQASTTRGTNLLSGSFGGGTGEESIEQLLGLDFEEFCAAVFLHQETIRRFITSTPEVRSAAIDRMLGTYLLRTLIKVVDPNLPAKAIQEANTAVEQLDRQLAQASVINREMLQKRKNEYGDPADLPSLLEAIRSDLTSSAGQLGISAPEATLASLESCLAAASRDQVHAVGEMESRAGQLKALKQKYEQAARTGRQTIDQRKLQYGDPATLPALLEEIQSDLTPLVRLLNLPIPDATVMSLDQTLARVPRVQLTATTELEKTAGEIIALGERYQRASRETIELVSVPAELGSLRANLHARISTLNQEIPPLTRQVSQRQAIEQELITLDSQIASLPQLHGDVSLIALYLPGIAA